MRGKCIFDIRPNSRSVYIRVFFWLWSFSSNYVLSFKCSICEYSLTCVSVFIHVEKTRWRKLVFMFEHMFSAAHRRILNFECLFWFDFSTVPACRKQKQKFDIQNSTPPNWWVAEVVIGTVQVNVRNDQDKLD